LINGTGAASQTNDDKKNSADPMPKQSNMATFADEIGVLLIGRRPKVSPCHALSQSH